MHSSGIETRGGASDEHHDDSSFPERRGYDWTTIATKSQLPLQKINHSLKLAGSRNFKFALLEHGRIARGPKPYHNCTPTSQSAKTEAPTPCTYSFPSCEGCRPPDREATWTARLPSPHSSSAPRTNHSGPAQMETAAAIAHIAHAPLHTSPTRHCTHRPRVTAHITDAPLVHLY